MSKIVVSLEMDPKKDKHEIIELINILLDQLKELKEDIEYKTQRVDKNKNSKK